jgi:hypothetical protein
MDLEENFRQVFGFKGFTGKVLRNKDLTPQKALKTDLGQLQGSSS